MLDKVEQTALQAIRRVGDLIRNGMGRVAPAEIYNKGPVDYVTVVDRESEKLIVDMIRREFPDHHIMAEETAKGGLPPGISWVIDPLDGTTNFIHGFPFVAISIAVCVDREVVLGMVLDPLRDELFTARRGQGAYLNGRRIQVRQVADLQTALIATGFPARAKHLLEPYLGTFRDVFAKVSGIRRAGSAALDLAYVAAGRVDGFWEVGLQPWDVAAGSLLVVEAGGLVNDFHNSGRYLHNGHIVAGTTLVQPFLAEQIQHTLAPAVLAAEADGAGRTKCRNLIAEE